MKGASAMSEKSASKWAKEILGEAKLGDKRRTYRAVEVLAQLAEHPGQSIPELTDGRDALAEKIYRHARSEHVDSGQILEAGLRASRKRLVAQCKENPRDILILQDTTNLDYSHKSVRSKLKPTSTSLENGPRGWLVHNALAVDAESGDTLELVGQMYWSRDPESHGQRKQRKQRAFEEKESFKWQAIVDTLLEPLYEICEHLIIVSDRESDVYEYLMGLIGEGWRFIVRASWNRSLIDTTEHLNSYKAHATVRGYAALDIDQKGGRKAYTGRVEVRSCRVTLKPKATSPGLPDLTVNAIYLHEPIPLLGEEAFNGILLTNEPVETPQALDKVLRSYGLRWIIEEYHKCWKSDGQNVEGLRSPEPDNLLRLAIPMAFAAVYLMRIRQELVGKKPYKLRMIEEIDPQKKKEVIQASKQDAPCDRLLNDHQWHVLWTSVEKTKLPLKVPSLKWAGSAIAKLGGFMDSKRTGRPGYKALWKGWISLMDRCESVRLSLLLLTPQSIDTFSDV